MARLILSVILIWFFNACSQAQTGDNMKALMTKLFTTDGYNKEVRPSLNQSEPLRVDLDLFLVAVNGIDEVGQKLITTGFVDIYWKDEYLQWAPATYGDLSTIYVSQDKIWKPDISLQNGFKKLEELGNGFIKVIIEKDGMLRWSPFEIFETKCDINIEKFPFDEQTCDIIFVVWSYSISEVKISKGSKGINFYNFKGNGEWKVVSTSATVDSSAETRVKFSLTVRRIPTFYLINVIAPIVLLAVLNIFTFALPVDCGEKMSYSITVFLSFAVFLSIVSSTLPKTAGSILEFYLMFQLGMGTIVVIVTAVELRLHFRAKPVPKWLQVVFTLSFIKYMRSKKNVGCSDVNTQNDSATMNGEVIKTERTHTDSTELTWPDIIARVDMILFWVLLVTVIIMTLIIYLLLTN
ncbi:neuronal acetylcholine receptor subunit alpha-6-like [Mytilus californianus]|uniref:neuronal acetylcholine receptor subunit alpha-6-like n=1 Tax=Mytilus californianus TaxID=6549 RepID=UPI002247F209|nr:neuronal acetylcholine receptor subunit alpha-6-like [Mytilus californianus]